MKKIWLKRIVAVLVFLVALLIIDAVMNRGNTEITMDMPKATLPVVSVEIGSHKINTMYGYTTKREEAFTKDSITPIAGDRTISLVIDTFQADVEKVAYEVRSIDGSRLIEGSDIATLKKTSDEIRFSIQLKDLTQENEEYAFVTILTLEDGRKVYYYTRFIQNEAYYEEEKLDFIREFHDITLGTTDGSEIRKYLESNSKGDNSTFHKVTINSSLKQVMWDMLPVEEVQEPLILVKDITKDTVSVVLRYLIKEIGSKEQDYAFVEEYYRVRYTPDRMYLLDYERTMDEIFDVDKSSFGNDKINLGISNPEFELLESEGGKNLAFVNANRLLVYDNEENKLSLVFSFYDENNFDLRTRNRNFEVHMLKMEDSGNLTFAVSGYLNRGIHEGHVGIVIYYYDAMQNVIEEQAFIPYAKSADILNAELNHLLYLNMENHLFLILEGSLYDVDLTAKSYQTIETGLNAENYKVSDSGRMIAWLKQKSHFTSNIVVWKNLNDGSTKEIRAGYGEYISVLGFMGEDLIYGCIKREDVRKEISGNVFFPIYKAMIKNHDGDVLKEYEKENIYISGCTIENNQITLKRLAKISEDSYKVTDDEHIASSDIQNEAVNKVNTVAVDIYETVVQILLKNAVDTFSLKIMTPKEVIFEGGREVRLELPEEARFYVYGDGVELITSSPAEAVSLAYDRSGSVVNEKGNYVWKKGKFYTRNQIMAITGLKNEKERDSLATCLDAILEFEGISRQTQPLINNGEDAYTILDKILREKQILDLTGCSLDEVLYYNDLDIPVLALMENGEAYLVIGFNEYNVVLMNPVNGTVYKHGMNDSRDMFEENGNRFLTYIDAE